MNDHRDLSELDLTIAHVGVARLQAAYGDCVTRQAWHELVDLFTPDCPIRLDLRSTVLEFTGPVDLGSFIAGSISQFQFFTFTIVNSAIDIGPDGTTATARQYIRELRHGREETPVWTTALGLYRDSYVKVDGRWLFSARDYSSLARTTPDGTGMETFAIPDGHDA